MQRVRMTIHVEALRRVILHHGVFRFPETILHPAHFVPAWCALCGRNTHVFPVGPAGVFTISCDDCERYAAWSDTAEGTIRLARCPSISVAILKATVVLR